LSCFAEEDLQEDESMLPVDGGGQCHAVWLGPARTIGKESALSGSLRSVF
jgi:hypothetical protein